MNSKAIIIIALVFLFSAFSVAACGECTDTDQAAAKGHLGSWGDNGLLGGMTTGEAVKVPEGCTGTPGNYVCEDRCEGTTLIEYYCGFQTETPKEICHTEKVKECHVEMKNVCEWKFKRGHWVKECTQKPEQICEWNDKKVCKNNPWSDHDHFGGLVQSVVKSKEYPNSPECKQEVPEFNAIAVIGALVAGIGIVAYRRYN